MRHIPNILTVLRILATPAIGWAIVDRQFRLALLMTFVFSMSDTIDGRLARRYGWTSRFGAIADPIADKLMMAIVYGALLWIGEVPVWFVALVFGRDLLILLVAACALAFTKLRDFPPSIWGKISTLFQMLAAGTILVHLSGLLGDIDWLRVALISISTCATAFSGAHYLHRAFHQLRVARLKRD